MDKANFSGHFIEFLSKQCTTDNNHLAEQLLTTQLVQRLLRVGITVAPLPNMVGFQLNIGSDGCDWLITGLQVHAGEKGQATCARLVFNPLIES